MHIDNIVASTATPPTVATPNAISIHTGPTRPAKIWCDKWIHEGKCAFTQQGCKYRHEMPMDTETQERLGLFSGPPAWFLRKRTTETRMGRPMHGREVMYAGDSFGGGITGGLGGGVGGGGGGGGGGQFNGQPVQHAHYVQVLSQMRPLSETWRQRLPTNALVPAGPLQQPQQPDGAGYNYGPWNDQPDASRYSTGS